MRKSVMALLLALALLLSACGGQPDGGAPDSPEETGPLTLTVAMPWSQMTLDPAMNTAPGGEMILYHLFENLLRWEDDGNGWAVLAPGQAESWEAETDYAGNTTYTFTLREGLQWSDGRAVTAGDFVAAWRRLADPAKNLRHRELLQAVSGYGQVQETGDTSLLAVSAPDDRTFVVSLDGSCPYFLAQVCAGAYTVPVPPDLEKRSGWGATASGTVTNGPYTAVSFERSLVVLERSATYYAPAAGGPEELQFTLSKGSEADYESFQAGELDLITDLPSEALESLAADETWTPEAVTQVSAVLLNTEQPPFDDPDVRRAFLLAVDHQAAAAAVGPAARPAVGIVPYGVGDCIPRTEPEAGDGEDAAAETSLPYWDFRAHSLERVTVPAAGDYEENCQEAKALLAQAGYPGGRNFPAVEYIYVESETGGALAASLQAMWREQLGVTVSVRALSQEEYDAMLLPAPPEENPEDGTEGSAAEDTEETNPEEETPPRTTGAYTLAGTAYSVGRWDACGLLSLWHSGENPSGYASDGFDILLDSAAGAVSAEAWDAYLHDAEAVLLNDAPVIPVCYAGGAYLLGEGLTGLCRAPDGVYFLSGVHRGTAS